ncbi:hypothetical protein [Terricaulis sp.]|uniref:hypothetical protein n=1 Tax=Terricaulis sp. TaxID=2768686 RepID=UPI0037832F5E
MEARLSPSRAIWSAIIGLLIWVLYKGIWDLAHVMNFAKARGVDDAAFLAQGVLFSALGNAVEFVVWFALAALLWIVPYRFGQRGLFVAAFLGAACLFFLSALTLLFFSGDSSAEIDWDRLRPGPISMVHFAVAGGVAAFASQFAQVRTDAGDLVEDFN